MIGHPEGQPLHLSRGRCQSDGEYPVDGTDVVHNCATLAGSSGSLVFTSEGQVVGLHFLGGQTFGGREINRAVRMAALVENSNFLDEIFGKGPSTSGDQACQRITVPDGFTCTQENGDIRIVAEAGSAIFHMRPGEKLPQEWERARALCMLDEIEICTHLGAAFQYGIEVEKDIVRARLLYAHACNYGDRNACSNLGELYEKGLGVERDVDRAISIYDQSCPDRNFSEGADCFNLGRFLP